MFSGHDRTVVHRNSQWLLTARVRSAQYQARENLSMDKEGTCKVPPLAEELQLLMAEGTVRRVSLLQGGIVFTGTIDRKQATLWG